ncbi:MAG: glycosyltransferase family 2 protein [Chloroflexi bacterium]|nr:glycosyltransferase family 2 protein [Chloroflexota bacterium]
MGPGLPTEGTVQLSIVIPAYNEASGIGTALFSLREYLEALPGLSRWEVIVVDDGSRDGSAMAVEGAVGEDPRFRLVRHERNRGKGCAVRAGMLAAQGRYAGFMDADLSTHLVAVAQALGHLAESKDVVIASRRVPGARIVVAQSWPRRMASQLFRLAAQWLVGLKDIRDSQCGFKFFRGAVAQELFPLLTTDGFLFDVELLALAQRRGYRVLEMPVTWTNRKQSRLRVWPLAYQVLADLVRIRRRLHNVPS